MSSRIDMAELMAEKRRQTIYWWRKQPIGISTYDAALQRAEFAYEHYDHISVAFSGGKDSTAVLNVTLEVARRRGALPLEVQFLDEEGITTETVEYIRRVIDTGEIAMEWYCLPVTHRNACSATHPWWYPWAPEEEERWVRPLPAEAITHTDLPGYTDPGPHGDGGERNRPTWPELSRWIYEQRSGRTACLMGIRSDESMTRFKAVSNNRRENFVIPVSAKVDKVYPIYDWSTQDVWTAPRIHGWDHNLTYDVMEMAGIPPTVQRLAPPFGDEPSKNLWMWSVCFPDIWEKLCLRVPGAGTAARYASTELYAHKGLPARPAGVEWPDFIRQVIQRHEDPNERALVANKLQEFIRRHYNKTDEPILDVPHPMTGLSWPYLLMIAVRGDLKERRQASMPYPKTQAEADRYYDALDEQRAAGAR